MPLAFLIKQSAIILLVDIASDHILSIYRNKNPVSYMTNTLLLRNLFVRLSKNNITQCFCKNYLEPTSIKFGCRVFLNKKEKHKENASGGRVSNAGRASSVQYQLFWVSGPACRSAPRAAHRNNYNLIITYTKTFRLHSVACKLPMSLRITLHIISFFF